MLGEIQKASQTTVEAATHSRDAVQAGRQKSVEAGEVMQRVADGAHRDAESSQQAAASAQQQLAGMEQIAQAIQSINQASDQSVEGTRQVDQAIEHLQELARELRRLVQSRANDQSALSVIGDDRDRS
jgi:methyl-accepting chemotaxis protein